MTVLSNNVINPDDVAAHWLDVLEEMVDERVDYDGHPIEPDYEDGCGSITIGNRRIRIVGAWSEVVFQWFEVGGAWSEGDYRLPLTFDADETVDRYGTTVEELLDEAVEFLEGWRADIVWDDIDYCLWEQLEDPEVVVVEGEGNCYLYKQGYVWSYRIDAARGHAEVCAGWFDDEDTIYWSEWGIVEGIDVIFFGLAKAVAHAVEDVQERLGE